MLEVFNGEPNQLNYGTRELLKAQAKQNGIGKLVVFPRENSFLHNQIGSRH